VTPARPLVPLWWNTGPEADLVSRVGAILPLRYDPAPGFGRRPALCCPVDPADPASRNRLAPGSAFHRSWVARRAEGPLAIVAPSRRGDAYLAERGISGVLGDQA
jgi:hypothetical protein